MSDLTTSVLRELQAQIRTLRGELKPVRETYVTRAEMLAMVTTITDRFAEFEAHMDSRTDAVEGRLSQIEALLATGKETK